MEYRGITVFIDLSEFIGEKHGYIWLNYIIFRQLPPKFIETPVYQPIA